MNTVTDKRLTMTDTTGARTLVATIIAGLAAGERYAGMLLGADGLPEHHVILLPGEATDSDWQSSKDWAASIGGALPSRREQSLLFTNLKDQFQPRWYWSDEQHAAYAGYAWLQYFDDGDQYGNGYLSYEGRARAVRRLEI